MTGLRRIVGLQRWNAQQLTDASQPLLGGSQAFPVRHQCAAQRGDDSCNWKSSLRDDAKKATGLHSAPTK